MRGRILLLITSLSILWTPAVASAAFPHTVASGESLYSIAASDGLSVDQLAAANGLAPDAQLAAGSTLLIPPQGGTGSAAERSTSTTSTGSTTSTTSTGSTGSTATSAGDSDGDDDDAGAATGASAATASTTAPAGYVVQSGDTLSAIAARNGTSVSELAAANGLNPAAVLPAGIALRLSHTSGPPSSTNQAPAVGTSIVGRMTWFGGPHDPGAQGAPASGLGWRSDGMSFYNYGSLGHRWLIRFPWGQTLNMSQIDIGPAPWTGNPFDIAFSALPNTPYGWQTWPNPIVTGTYQGG